ncbi:unnamed protein product [Closterium sp. Naga37s-1]|nr:unnamed protein product [Closterium sp. Naga37s-1]
MAPRLPVENGSVHHPHAESRGQLSASAGSDGGKAEQSPPSPATKGVDGDAAALSPALVASGDEGKATALSRHSAADWVAMVLWMGWLHILLALLLLIALTFPHPLAIALLLLLATLAVAPVDVEGPLAQAYRRSVSPPLVLRSLPLSLDNFPLLRQWPPASSSASKTHRRFIYPVVLRHFLVRLLFHDRSITVTLFIYPVVLRHFPVRLLFHDRSAVTFGEPYVIAVEPHSVLPVGLGAFMCHPLAAGGVAGATSAIFRVPLLRQCWQWARLAPATRPVLSSVLQRGRPVIIVPGGVQECLFMAPGKEVVFVRQRFGFIRLALQHGVPLLPCFAFGQTSAYRWWRPEGAWYRWVARRIGFAPIVFWGMWGSPIPFRTPLTIAIGTPIGQGDPEPNPSKERVAAVHAEYVRALERLFLHHRAHAGYPTTHLEIM